MIIVYILIALIVLFFAVILIRAALFLPAPEAETVPEEVSFDRDAAIASLRALIRCKTVSYPDADQEDDAEFEKLISLLPELYPGVAVSCTLQRFPDRGLLYRWPGREPGEPAVLMAHYDVVPVEESQWLKPPFEAIIEDGVMWGRGTLDTKVTFNGILSAAENLIAQGFQPLHDVYFAFSGGEEILGPGAKHIVDFFAQQGITPSMVVDEGGAVVEDVFPGVIGACAMVGIAEKGQINLEYSISSGGGHASAPPKRTSVGRLSEACKAVEDHPFPMRLTKPVLDMFDTLGRRSTFLYRIIFANLWCFRGVLDGICRKGGGELNALVRTTVAFTMMQGSQAANVLPPTASMVSNIRINPADSVAFVKRYIRNTVKDAEITLKDLKSFEPSPISRTDCEGWRKVSRAVSETWRGCVVTPYLMMQCSDSRHYRDLSDRVYRFSAMDMTKEERSLIHGNNERIRLEAIGRAIEFYIRLMKLC